MDAAEVRETAETARIVELADASLQCGPHEAVELLEPESDETIVSVLSRGNPALADEILWAFSAQRRQRILAAAPANRRDQWSKNHLYPEDSIGRLMDPPVAVLRPEQTVGEVIERLRGIVKKALVTYGWVVDGAGRLQGVVVFRDLLFANDAQPISDIMVTQPYSLRPEMSLTEGMRDALARHFPVYPVCDGTGRLVGIVRGHSLFEHQAFELSAQAGAMVGVEKEERLATAWTRSLRFRHPWLQLNLLTAFSAAAVVGAFQNTLDQLVVLTAFLPVLAGQSGNTGCQALAVSLRGITLGELSADRSRLVVAKEGWLGLLNGAMVGLTAAAGMFAYAWWQNNPRAALLALCVFLAMAASCTISGIAGAVIPMALRRFGADPATASSIVLTTVTDVVSIGAFLGLATLLVM